MDNLEAVLRDFEQRLSAIESQLHQVSQVESSRSTNSIATFTKGFDDRITQGSPKPVGDGNMNVSTEVKSIDSSTILAVIGIVFVILAGAFFIKMSIESGWLTPARQVVLAAACGIGFFLAPQFLSSRARAYGALLGGAGTTILHLTWLGAYSIHHILPPTVALVCATLVGLGSVIANFAEGNRVYMLVAMAGTYLAAPIVGYDSHDLPVLLTFLMIWNISYSAAALLQRRRDILVIASYYAVFTLLLLTGQTQDPEQLGSLLVQHFVQFLIFAAAMLAYSINNKLPLDKGESVATLFLLLLFYWTAGHLVTLILPNLAPWFGVATGAFVLSIYAIGRRFLGKNLNSDQYLISFVSIAWAHSFYFQLLSESLQPLGALGLAMLAVIIWAKWPSVSRQFYWPCVIWGSTIIYGAALTILSADTISSLYVYNLVYGAFALFIFLILTRKIQLHHRRGGYLPVLLGFGHLEVLLGLYRFSQDISWSGALFVSLSWGLYALLIMAASYWRRDKTLGHSALTILLAVSLKAFFYDLSNTSNLIRVFCLLLEGLLLYGCGWIIKKMQTWEIPNPGTDDRSRKFDDGPR